ncbi:MAG: hypothetical protein KIS67_02780 [Verrucomicrobiae bacterium]|nr:hypothetical protein [Verrucomicrobiae bacterium]
MGRTLGSAGVHAHRDSTWPASEPLPRNWGVNVAFADGHVERVKLPELRTLSWHRTWEQAAPSWNPPGRP